MKGLEDKCQITAVFCGTLCGQFLSIQLIYGGKTNRCNPISTLFPVTGALPHSSNHWPNETTMFQYIDEMIVPLVDGIRHDLGVGEDQAALAVFDCFKVQLTCGVAEALEKHNIQSVIVPATCTDHLQPLDLSVNRRAKALLRSQFQQWYADEVASFEGNIEDLEAEDFATVDLSAPRMKCIGAQWLVRLYEYFEENPKLIVSGFVASGIPQSIDKGTPYLAESDSSSEEEDSTDEEYSTEEEYGTEERTA